MSRRTLPTPVDTRSEDTPRFLSAEDCQALIHRVDGMATGGGETMVFLDSQWTGNLRWARNRIISSGDVRNNSLTILRSIHGAVGNAETNQTDDRHLAAAVLRAERMESGRPQGPDYILTGHPFLEPYPKPKIWFDSTFRQDAEKRAEIVRTLVAPAEAAGMFAAGYIQVSATGRSSMEGSNLWYYPYTQAQYSVTVRSPDGSGSGWAGVDWNDWDRIDAKQLSAIALDKCLRSRNPVRLEPGRYTTILEPQAVGDLAQILFGRVALSREYAEYGDPQFKQTDPEYKPDSKNPFNAGKGYSRIGEKVIDERLSVTTDDMDPDLGFPPFEGWQVYHPVNWIKNGVLQELAYYRKYAVQRLHRNTGGQPQFGEYYTGAFKISVTGPTTSIDEMIATTKRGVLVTRFSGIALPPVDAKSMTVSGYTRDGVWLIENNKISHPIMNFRFTESPLFMLNNVDQVGTPQRIFHPSHPIVAPALKVRDFSFTSLSDAV